MRRLLTRMGLRYRLQRRDLPGRPDLALGPRKVAVFVHGCFWHAHDCRRGARQPKQNAAYWIAKIARNRARDAAAVEALTAKGWRALIVWECELKDAASLEARLRDELHLPLPANSATDRGLKTDGRLDPPGLPDQADGPCG